MKLKRIISASAIALGVTFGLFGLMVTLISSGDASLDEAPQLNLANILMPEREISEHSKNQKPKKPQQDVPPPDIPPPEFDDIQLDDSSEITSPNMIADLKIDLSGVSASDGEYLPIVKVAPQYPRRAMSKGIQGYVVLEFTVTKLGTVRDPIVLESSPPGYFEQAARKAVVRFKYKPSIIDGVAIDVPHVTNKIVFKLAG